MQKLREGSTQSSAVQNYQPPFLFVIFLVKTSLAIMIVIFIPSKNHKPCSKKERPSIHHSRKIIRKNPPGLSLVVEVTVTMPSFALGLLITFKTQSGTLGLVGASTGMNRRMGVWMVILDGWSKIPCKARTNMEKNDRVNL